MNSHNPTVYKESENLVLKKNIFILKKLSYQKISFKKSPKRSLQYLHLEEVCPLFNQYFAVLVINLLPGHERKISGDISSINQGIFLGQAKLDDLTVDYPSGQFDLNLNAVNLIVIVFCWGPFGDKEGLIRRNASTLVNVATVDCRCYFFDVRGGKDEDSNMCRRFNSVDRIWLRRKSNVDGIGYDYDGMFYTTFERVVRKSKLALKQKRNSIVN